MNPRLLSQFPLTLVDTPCVVVIYHFFLFCPNIAFTFWIFINVFTSSSFFWPWIEGFHPLFRFPSCSQCSDIRLFTKTVHCYTLQVHCTFWYSVLSGSTPNCTFWYSLSAVTLYNLVLCTLSLQVHCTFWYSVLSGSTPNLLLHYYYFFWYNIFSYCFFQYSVKPGWFFFLADFGI